jgi:hypothetical protein
MIRNAGYQCSPGVAAWGGERGRGAGPGGRIIHGCITWRCVTRISVVSEVLVDPTEQIPGCTFA